VSPGRRNHKWHIVGVHCLALELSVGSLFASAPYVARAQDVQDAPPEEESASPAAPPEEESTSPVAPPNSARPVWRAQPSRRDVERHYPADSLYDHVTGNVILQCLVRAEDGGLLCVVVSETPEGRGFGEAALKVAQSYRAGPELQDGSPSAGARIRIMVAFGGR
jgi:outer membrane biosynthesis protein TonB